METVMQSAAPLETLKQKYRDYLDVKGDEIKESKTNRRYYHGNQTSEEIKRELNRRKQPIITSNFIRQTIDGIVGLDTRYRQDPKAYPRTPKHTEQSDVATASIRFVCDNNDWNSLASDCIMDATQSGIMVDEYKIEQKEDGQVEIIIERLEPEKFFYDPKSIKHDFSDATYMGSWGWFDLDTAIEMFPYKEEELNQGVGDGLDSVAENPQEDWSNRWFDTKRKLVKIVEIWTKKNGNWTYCFISGNSKLKSGTSPFLDDEGKSGCRFIAQSAYIDETGDRYSLIRDLRPLQDEINQRRSKMLHQTNVRQTWGRSGVVKDVNKVRMQMARPDGHVEMEGIFGQDWGIIDQNDQIAGQAALLEASKQEMESFGPGQALLGQGGLQDSSGRALALHLQAGMAKMQPFFNRIRSWKLRNYRMIWHNIRRYWDTERYIMITDDPNDIQHIPVNSFQLDEYGRPMPVNALADIDVDIIIDEAPDTITLQSEAFDKMVKLAPMMGNVAPDIWIEMSDLDSKTKTRIKKRLEQQQQQDPMAAQAAQLEMADKMAGIKQQEVDTQKAAAATEKLQAETLKILHEPLY